MPPCSNTVAALAVASIYGQLGQPIGTTVVPTVIISGTQQTLAEL